MRWSAGVVVSLALAAGAGRAHADPAPARLTVPIVDEHGGAVFCTRNDAVGLARPDVDGGYHLAGLRPGQWMVSLELPHERVDVLVTVPEGGDVVVPPVVARGLCQRLSLTRRPDLQDLVDGSAWEVRYGRTYRHSPGGIAQVGDGYRWRGRPRRMSERDLRLNDLDLRPR